MQRTVTKFHFSSFQHGCLVYGLGKRIDNIEVWEQQDEIEVFDVGSHDPPIVEKSVTRIHGKLYSTLFQWGTATGPFDVKVHAYNPVDDRDYYLDILDCDIIDEYGSFVAAKIRYWYVVSIGVLSGKPNQNRDVFVPDDEVYAGDQLVGKVKAWQAREQPYQHVDASVPPKEFVMDKEQKSSVAGTVRTGRIVCEECDEPFGVDLATGQCDRCGHILAVLNKKPPKIEDVLSTTNKISMGAKVEQPKCGACSHDAEPVRKPLRDIPAGTLFDLGNGTVVVRGNKEFKDMTKGGVGVVVDDGAVWYNNSGNFPAETKFEILCNVVQELEQIYNMLDGWHTEYTPREWCAAIKKTLKRYKSYVLKTSFALNVHTPEEALERINELLEIEAETEQQESGVLDGVKCFGNDTAHVGPWTTVRACLDCGVLVTGGPTRCCYCADKQSQTKRAKDFPVIGKCPLCHSNVMAVDGFACCEEACPGSGILNVDDWRVITRQSNQ